MNYYPSPEKVNPTPSLTGNNQQSKRLIQTQHLNSAILPESSPQQEIIINQKQQRPYKSIFQDSISQRTLSETKEFKLNETPLSQEEKIIVKQRTPPKSLQQVSVEKQQEIKSSGAKDINEINALKEMQSQFQMELNQQKLQMQNNFESIIEKIDNLSKQFKQLQKKNNHHSSTKLPKQQSLESKQNKIQQYPKPFEQKNKHSEIVMFSTKNSNKLQRTRQPGQLQQCSSLNESLSDLQQDIDEKIDNLQMKQIENQEEVYSYFRQKYGGNLKYSSIYPLQSVYKIPTNDQINFAFCTLCKQFIEILKAQTHSQYCVPKDKEKQPGIFEELCSCKKPEIVQISQIQSIHITNRNIEKIIYLIEKFSLSQLQHSHRMMRHYCRFGIRILELILSENMNKEYLKNYLYDLKLLFLTLDQLQPNLQLVFLLQKAIAEASDKIELF